MSEFLKLVGAKLRRLRKVRGFSQAELAHRAELQDTYIGGVERGERNISLLTLEKIVNVLEVETSEAFRFHDLDPEQDATEIEQVLKIHNSLLRGRSLEEVRMVHRIVKDMLETFDTSREGNKH
ncbi:helix-turn-helix transcriptional regulator [Paenibacillus sp. FSL P4-0338]|uniref:helix-turn-helix domain-containing protein n=1 Tax=Paenibacillus sp. FSL P4-0338 TaxID=2921635 RepID=UPI0030F4DCA5